MTHEDRHAVATRIADRLDDDRFIDARPWYGTEMGTVRVYCCEVAEDGLTRWQRGAIEVRAHEDGDVYAIDCTEGWTVDAHETIDNIIAGVCWGWNLRRRAA